jgi:hypothetical protein
MGKRGPKPVHLGGLHTWEFEWFKAFHLLREGAQLPEISRRPLTREDIKRIDARIERLQRMPLEKIVDDEPPSPDYEPKKEGDRPGLVMWRFWAESMRQREVGRFRAMKPREVYAKAERREIWNSLWAARRRSSVEQVCDRWEKLPDVIGLGFGVFPAHVRANVSQFLSITRNQRFPRSAAADDSRLDYLARGMAGVMVGVSPMTAIERLRNMSHKSGGPLWDGRFALCTCWRCDVKRAYDFEATGEEDTI